MQGLRTAWLVTLVLLGSTAARGEPLKAEDPEAEAQRLLGEGANFMQSGDLLRARTAFAAAVALVPDRPNPSRWLGLVDAQLGRCRDAIPRLEFFLSRSAADDPRRPEVVSTLERCRASVANEAPSPAPPSVSPQSPEVASPSVATTGKTRSWTRKWWVWTLVGVAVAGAGVGVGLGVYYGTRTPASPYEPIHVP